MESVYVHCVNHLQATSSFLLNSALFSLYLSISLSLSLSACEIRHFIRTKRVSERGRWNKLQLWLHLASFSCFALYEEGNSPWGKCSHPKIRVNTLSLAFSLDFPSPSFPSQPRYFSLHYSATPISHLLSAATPPSASLFPSFLPSLLRPSLPPPSSSSSSFHRFIVGDSFWTRHCSKFRDDGRRRRARAGGS